LECKFLLLTNDGPMNFDKNKSNQNCLFFRQLPALVMFFLLIFITNITCAQKEQDINKYEDEHENQFLPFFFEREPPVGTVYFTEYWMKGAAEFANHQTIPTREKSYYFNFDKMKNVLIVADNSANISYYHGDEVIQFILLDSLNKTYKFEIIPAISRSFYLQPVFISDSGYSIYKRLITKLAAADFQSYGYGSTGVKHDTYDDSYEYYFLYPDKKTYKKFYMDGAALKKVFRPWSDQLELQLNKYKGRLNEEGLVELVEYINKAH
jgi:hypothetical protein